MILSLSHSYHFPVLMNLIRIYIPIITCLSVATADRPNIILIMADDIEDLRDTHTRLKAELDRHLAITKGADSVLTKRRGELNRSR